MAFKTMALFGLNDPASGGLYAETAAAEGLDPGSQYTAIGRRYERMPLTPMADTMVPLLTIL